METITVQATQLGPVQSVDQLLDLQATLIGQITQGISREMRDHVVRTVRTGKTEATVLRALTEALDLRVLKAQLVLRATADLDITVETMETIREERGITDTATTAANTVGTVVNTTATVVDTGMADRPPIRAGTMAIAMADMMQATTAGIMAIITPGVDMAVMMDMTAVLTVGTREDITEKGIVATGTEKVSN